MKIRTRFAPSPTGYLHIGGVRTALFSWLYARKHGGDFILRIEDTDLERSTAESVNAILEGMTWLGLAYDQGPFFQTARFDRYQEAIRELLESGKAYPCYCSKEELDQMRAEQMERKQKPRYDGRCRDRMEPREGIKPVIRFRNPDQGEVVFEDLVKGKIVVRNEELDDLIIARSDGTPTYNLAVVIDDLDMGISHVVRGDDHINNTPRQINILKALGARIPQYGHLPMILGSDGARLSKRHGAVSVMQYRDAGYLPDALLNYLVRLGWSYRDQEIFSIDEMIERFDITDVNLAPSTFNPEKLLWLNHYYIKTADPAHIAQHLRWHLGHLNIDPSAGPDIVEVVKAQRDRSKTLVEMAKSSAFLYQEFSDYEAKAASKNLNSESLPVLETLRQGLGALTVWKAERIHGIIQAVVESRGLNFGKVAQPLRVAVSGSTASPAIDVTLELLGRDPTLARLDRAIHFIRAQNGGEIDAGQA
ncbi:MAG: glutamate--tRNA ligase [Methylococcaceae bacterium]|nr:glutamate--tRNA ligase [Methylococcaceae bacterium]MCI0666916.1 glutamate--tRNA ligase [Methylococcaceae bacterium]MCI0733018.1 glutamate--tRNA ligase [Methylococcaceae bacterium]